MPARQIAVEVQQGSLDFGALTFHPPEEGLLEVPVGSDELVLLVSPSHELAGRRQVTMAELAGHPVVAHNDPSPARERVLRLFEEHHITLNMVIALPSLDGIKRAVELNLGVALLPRRCAITEIASKRLVAVQVTGVSRKRQVMLVCRKAHRSHAVGRVPEDGPGTLGATSESSHLVIWSSGHCCPERNARMDRAAMSACFGCLKEEVIAVMELNHSAMLHRSLEDFHLLSFVPSEMDKCPAAPVLCRCRHLR